MNDDIILKVNKKGWKFIEQTLLQLPGANGVHEFIEELRSQVNFRQDLDSRSEQSDDNLLEK